MMLRPAALILALAASSLAWGESFDPPERIAHLSYVEGQVTFQGAHSRATSELPDRPLVSGDRLVTGPGGRVELTLGTAAIRLDEHSELTIADLDESSVRFDLNAGSADVYLRELRGGESFEIATPNAVVTLPEPGEYRLDVPADDSTVLSVRGGLANVETAAGPVRIVDGQRVRLDGRDAYALLESTPEADAFDDWVMNREERLAEADTSQYGPEDERAYDELDRYGEWTNEPRYGRVWMPAYADSGWSPYGYGYWQRVGFGFAWIDPSPWGFDTFHRGRWAYLHDRGRWCWMPERRRRDHDRLVVRETHPMGHPPLRRAIPRPDRTATMARETMAREDLTVRNRGGDRREAPPRAVMDSRATPRRGSVMVPGRSVNQGAQATSAPRSSSGTATHSFGSTSRRNSASADARRSTFAVSPN